MLNLFRDCRDDLAHKIARVKGELHRFQCMIEHYEGKAFNPQTHWNEHASKMNMLVGLKKEYAGLAKRLAKLQNRDVAAHKKELDNA